MSVNIIIKNKVFLYEYIKSKYFYYKIHILFLFILFKNNYYKLVIYKKIICIIKSINKNNKNV